MKKLVIDYKNRFPRDFCGWGTSLCWWANRIGYSDKMVRDSAELFFSEKGLGLNIMRYNIGGGDDPTHNHITRTDSDMPGWLKKNPQGELYYDYTADKNQLNILRACYQAAGEDAYVEAFSNSPPYFMTVSGCSSGSRSAIANNLKKSCVRDFAEYLAEVSAYINNELGIRVSSLAAMNEPYTPYWRAYSEKQEGCHVSPGRMQSLLLEETARAVRSRGLEQVDITASDETNTRLQYAACKRLTPQAWQVVDRISTHTYSKATPHIARLAREKNKPLWMTETDWSETAGEDSGEMGPGLWLGLKIIEDLNTLECDAWVIWQIVASYISQREYKGRRDLPCLPGLTRGYWGTAFADTDKQELILTRKYYCFGQFSRYIRPGSRLIKVDKEAIACYDRRHERLVIVCLNCKREDVAVRLQPEGFCTDGAEPYLIRTSGSNASGEDWKRERLHTDTVCLKGNSITTVVYENVRLKS